MKFIPRNQIKTDKYESNNILFLINYNASKNFFVKIRKKMTTSDKKFSNFLI